MIPEIVSAGETESRDKLTVFFCRLFSEGARLGCGGGCTVVVDTGCFGVGGIADVNRLDAGEDFSGVVDVDAIVVVSIVVVGVLVPIEMLDVTGGGIGL